MLCGQFQFSLSFFTDDVRDDETNARVTGGNVFTTLERPPPSVILGGLIVFLVEIHKLINVVCSKYVIFIYLSIQMYTHVTGRRPVLPVTRIVVRHEAMSASSSSRTVYVITYRPGASVLEEFSSQPELSEPNLCGSSKTFNSTRRRAAA